MQIQTGDIADRDAFQPGLVYVPRTALPFGDIYYDPFDKMPVDTFYWATPGRAIKKFHRDGSPICALGSFHADLRFPGSIQASAFEGMAADGFQQGHAIPAEAMQFDRMGLADTFGTPNVWAQRAKLNQGAMKSLEGLIFKAQTREKLGVHTGRIFEFAKTKERLPSGVAIPDAFFKVVFSPARQRVACYILANNDSVESSIDLHYVPLARVCALTGFIFPALVGYKDDPRLLYPQPELLKLDIGGNALQIENLCNGQYVLLAPYVWNPQDKAFPRARLRLKPGLTTDFGSTPRGTWNLFPPIGTFRDPDFLGHDALYASQYYEWDKAYKIIKDTKACRAECDWRLLEALEADGDSWTSRNTIWSAVKLGGGSVWKEHTPEGIAAARTLIETVRVP